MRKTFAAKTIYAALSKTQTQTQALTLPDPQQRQHIYFLLLCSFWAELPIVFD